MKTKKLKLEQLTNQTSIQIFTVQNLTAINGAAQSIQKQVPHGSESSVVSNPLY